jgi:hypothetical protein
MSEFGEYEAGQEHASLEAVHGSQGSELEHESQYGILEQDHRSVEHEEFERLKHIEYTDAYGNHYEVTEYTHYERTEIEEEHSFLAYGEDAGGQAGFGAADGEAGFGEAGFGQAGFGEAGFGSIAGLGATSAGAGLESITSRFENFLGSGVMSDNEINDSSA